MAAGGHFVTHDYREQQVVKHDYLEYNMAILVAIYCAYLQEQVEQLHAEGKFIKMADGSIGSDAFSGTRGEC